MTSSTNTDQSAFLHSLTLWNRFTSDNTAMLWSAGEVIGKRTARMASHGLAPNAKERRELQGMIEEKQVAMFEGSIAAWSECVKLSHASWLEAMRMTMRGSTALMPLLASPTSREAARNPSQEELPQGWHGPFVSHLKIVDAAFKPVRARVAANRKRLFA